MKRDIEREREEKRKNSEKRKKRGRKEIIESALIDYIKVLRHINTKRVIQCQNR